MPPTPYGYCHVLPHQSLPHTRPRYVPHPLPSDLTFHHPKPTPPIPSHEELLAKITPTQTKKAPLDTRLVIAVPSKRADVVKEDKVEQWMKEYTPILPKFGHTCHNFPIFPTTSSSSVVHVPQGDTQKQETIIQNTVAQGNETKKKAPLDTREVISNPS